MKTIAISGKGALEIPLSELRELQGDLKDLPPDNLAALRGEIEDTGFAFTPHVWKNPKDKKWYLVDGHQRVRALKSFEKDGYKVPPIPCSIVEAKNIKEAKRRVLQGTSQYGIVTDKGLHRFAGEAGVSFEALCKNFRLPGISMPHFQAKFHLPPGDPRRGMSEILGEKTNFIPLVDAIPHPLNFRKYLPEQVDHIVATVKEIGAYRTMVVTSDGYVVAGHGLYEAAKKLELERLPVKHLPYDGKDFRALKILLNDNDLGHMSEVDDRALTELLKELKEKCPTGLAGTGYDEKMLASLLMVTRPTSEIRDIDEASQWVGMPEFEDGPRLFKIIISVENEEAAAQFLKVAKVKTVKKGMNAWSFRWPEVEKVDAKSVRFDS